MKILIVTQYFWPERFRINDLVFGLKERGVEIEVLTGKPNYPDGRFFEGYGFYSKTMEYYNGVKIRRCSVFPRGKGGGFRLALNYISFVFFGSLKSIFIKDKFDKIFVFGTSPITACIPAIIYAKKNKIPVFLWVQDLWPESVKAVGMVNNKFILNILNLLTIWIYKNCHKILIQSNGFAEYILKQNVDADDLIYYPNSTESLYQPIRAKESVRGLLKVDGFKLLFAGNVGEAQDFDNVLMALQLVVEKVSNFHLFIVGNGRRFEFVKNKVTEMGISSNVHLLGSYPIEDMPHFFSEADALLVSLKDEGIFNLTIPSKIQSYLACGKPIIGSLNGEGAKIISESKSGIVVPASNPELLADAMFQCSSFDSSILKEFGLCGRSYFEKHFERNMLLSKIINIFNIE